MLAQTGAEVLIVDCDLRRPRLHAHFDVPNSRGLTNWLSGETDLDGLLQTYDKHAKLETSDLWPCAAESGGASGFR